MSAAPIVFCQGSGSRVELSEDERLSKLAKCPICARAYGVRVGRNERGAAATIPRHKAAEHSRRPDDYAAVPMVDRDVEASIAWGIPIALPSTVWSLS